jgi:hypothetical protein
MSEHDDVVRRLLGPAGPELTCDECFEHVDRYVDAELRDGEAAADRAIPGMRAHLAGCQACAEEHATLLALAGEGD